LASISTNTTLTQPRIYPSSVARYLLAALGLASVGMGAVGVVVPGLPTTIFLIIATWCFTRSCPWLTERLIHNRFFSPFVRYVVPGAVMPRRAKAVAIAMMWTAIAGSCWLITRGDAPGWVPLSVVGCGVIGTWAISRQGRRARRAHADAERLLRHGTGRSVRTHKNPACMTTTAGSSTTR
jgi:uncharacterized membrane protein YbaN (DUF454 family)